MRFIYATILAFIAIFSVIRYVQAAPHALERRYGERYGGTISGIMDKKKGDKISSVTIMSGGQTYFAENPDKVIKQNFRKNNAITFIIPSGTNQLAADIALLDSPAYVTRATSTSVALKEYTSGRNFFVAEEEMEYVKTLNLAKDDDVTFRRGEGEQSAYHITLKKRAKKSK